MSKHFEFLSRAKAASLYKLLQKLPMEDAAVVLAGLPASLGVQTMAYYPEKIQGELMDSLRAARQASSEKVVATAESVKKILLAARDAAKRENGGDGVSPDAPSPSATPAAPARPVGRNPIDAYRPKSPTSPRREAGESRSDRSEQKTGPVPWIPRAAETSPINGKPVPGHPKPITGDPLKSPLARAGLLELLGRAQQKLMPKGTAPSTPPKGTAAARPSALSGKKPEPREGVITSGKVPVSRSPLILGAERPGRETVPAKGAKRMDGKAVLAAILREAGQKVRRTVAADDPALMRELKERMFFFDDLIFTEDKALAMVFTAAPAEESALALRFAAPALRERVLDAVSPGRAGILRDVRSGRAGVDDIEAAQKKVLDVALQMQAAGRILIDPRDPDLAG